MSPKYPVIDKAPGFWKTGEWSPEKSFQQCDRRAPADEYHVHIYLYKLVLIQHALLLQWENFSIGDYTTFAVTSGFCAPFRILRR